MDLQERGTLPIGVLHDGRRCREFTLRRLRVRDHHRARNSMDLEKAGADEYLLGLISYAVRLEIDGIPREAMDLEFMLDMDEEDLEEVLEAERRLTEQVARFRGKNAAADNSGTSQNRDSMEGSGGDVPGDGSNVD